MSMDAADLAAVVTGRTRVRHTTGACGVVIGPLPDPPAADQWWTTHLRVQFDGDGAPCSVSWADLTVVTD